VGPHPDLRETYAAASVVLAPRPLGTGLKLKVVEGMAAGRAVVTTPAGAEGFDELENGSTAVVADSAQTFADSVVRLLRDPASRRQIAARQLDWISRRLNPEAALAPLFAAGF
jgi:glycosyltransferase involved in cell wall biosynthesis